MFYDLAKVAVNRLAFSQGHELRPHGATAVAITPGWLRSEMMLDNFGVSEENWHDAVDRKLAPPDFALSESPRYVGRAVAALATDPDRNRWNQRSVTSAQLAHDYGFTDLDGSRPDIWRYFEAGERGLRRTSATIGNAPTADSVPVQSTGIIGECARPSFSWFATARRRRPAKFSRGRRPGLHLAEEGQRQANVVAARIDKLPKVAAVYASQLERARETALPIARTHGLAVRIDRDLADGDVGEWTGQKLRHLARKPEWQIVQRHPERVSLPRRRVLHRDAGPRRLARWAGSSSATPAPSWSPSRTPTRSRPRWPTRWASTSISSSGS